MLSLSILGPSFIVLIDNQADIEVALELGEDENKKETKKELDEKDTFFELYRTTAIAKKSHVSFQNTHAVHLYGSHIIDVQSPPPEHKA